MTKIFNKSSVKSKRQELRKNMPKAEVLLWAKLKGKQLKGYKFRRQYSVENFILDFYCPQTKLCIEIDGDSHYNPKAQQYDARRREFLKSVGIQTLRFTNPEVYENLEGVLSIIMDHLP